MISSPPAIIARLQDELDAERAENRRLRALLEMDDKEADELATAIDCAMEAVGRISETRRWRGADGSRDDTAATTPDSTV